MDRLPTEERPKEETTMTMVHDPRHQRGACTPQGTALCFGVAVAGLVLAAIVLSWFMGLFNLLF